MEIPSSITYVTFAYGFNQPVNHLPSSIIHLSFGHDFNQPVEHLPNSIKHLEFKYRFNQLIKYLPHKIVTLTISGGFNKPLPPLPSSLTSLRLKCPKLNHVIDSLPPSLAELAIRRSKSPPSQPLNSLPPTIKRLTLEGNFQELDHIPLGLQCLKVFGATKAPKVPYSIPKYEYTGFQDVTDNLPLYVTYLKFSDNQIKLVKINNLPSSITHLIISGKFNEPIDDLPTSLTHLTLSGSFNQPVDHLPTSMTHLNFLGPSFNQPVDHLPPHITHLQFEVGFDQNIDHLPDSIQNLSLGLCYSRHMHGLPSSLTHLTLCETRASIWFPPHLQIIDLHEFDSDYRRRCKSFTRIYWRQHTARFIRHTEKEYIEFEDDCSDDEEFR